MTLMGGCRGMSGYWNEYGTKYTQFHKKIWGNFFQDTLKIFNGPFFASAPPPPPNLFVNGQSCWGNTEFHKCCQTLHYKSYLTYTKQTMIYQKRVTGGGVLTLTWYIYIYGPAFSDAFSLILYSDQWIFTYWNTIGDKSLHCESRYSLFIPYSSIFTMKYLLLLYIYILYNCK